MDSCRFYRNIHPAIGDIVMGKIVGKDEYGYFIVLLEYCNMNGFVQHSEMIQKRTRKKNIVKVDEIVPLLVLNIDVNKNCVTLSRRKVTQTEAEEFSNDFKYVTNLNILGREIYSFYKSMTNDTTYKVEDFMENTVWCMYDTDTNRKNTYYNVLKNIPLFLKGLTKINISDDFIASMDKNLNSRLLKDDTMLETEIKLYVTSSKGVYAIREILDIDTDKINNDYKLNIYMYSLPTYKIQLCGPQEYENGSINSIMDNIINIIQKRATDHNAKFMVINKNGIIKESNIDIKLLSSYEIKQLVKI